MDQASTIKRMAPVARKQMVPSVQEGGERICVDPSWGTIQPARLHPQIETIGELELIELARSGRRMIDTRKQRFVDQSGTIVGAIAIDWEHTDAILAALDPDRPTVLFCNGPQCAATPRAVEQLLAAGVDPQRLIYYRGGIHDWMTLGLPLGAPGDS